jgi:hypothetical protein
MIVSMLRERLSYLKKHPVTVSGSGVNRGTNELLQKSVLKNFLHFPKYLKIFYKLFFQAAIPIPDDDTNPNRSPSQVVISAFRMVIWVIF